MNTHDVARLFRMAQAAFPAQKFDDYTPDLWVEILAEIPYDDARAALVHCAKSREWLNLKDLLGEVRRVRTKRIDESLEKLTPPADLDPDDEPAYRRWLAGAIKRLGDGELPDPPKNLVRRDVRQLMASLGEHLSQPHATRGEFTGTIPEAEIVDDPEDAA